MPVDGVTLQEYRVAPQRGREKVYSLLRQRVSGPLMLTLSDIIGILMLLRDLQLQSQLLPSRQSVPNPLSGAAMGLSFKMT